MKLVLICFALTIFSTVGLGKSITLKNGSFFDAEMEKALPRQTVALVFPGGPSLVVRELQGMTEVIRELMKEGPASMQPEEYRRALFLANAEIDIYTSLRSMFVTVKAPVEKLDAALALAEKTLSEPRLDEASFKAAHAKVTSQTNVAFDEMQQVIFFYGMRASTLNNPDIYDGSGSPATVKNITLATVKESYRKIFDKSLLYFVSAGPGDPQKIAGETEKAFLSGKETPKFVLTPGRDIDPSNIQKKSARGLQVTVINKPNAADNQILFVFPEVIRRGQKEEVVGNVAHSMLGGGLAGRLGKTLRKERGLTYHASSFVTQPGWMVYTFGGDEQVEPLLKGVKEVIADFKKEKLTSTEIAEVKATLENAHRQRFELPADVLLEKIRLRLFARDENFVEKQPEYLKSTRPQDVQGFVAQKINAESGSLILMGDSTKLKTALSKAGFDASRINVVELDQVM